MDYSYRMYREAADFALSRTELKPQVGMVLGSNLGGLTERLRNSVVIDYHDIPHMPVTTVEDHAGKLYLGTLGGKNVAVMSGRFHYYEGCDPRTLAWAPRFFSCLGCNSQILTNIAGGVNAEFSPGDIMVITDHIMFHSISPLRGSNIDEFGPRFPDMTKAYSPRLIKIAESAAEEIKAAVRTGVYFYMPGPQFETPAEIRAIRTMGGDAVGMSTVAEVIAGAHAGIETLAFSIIANPAAGMTDTLDTACIDGTVESVQERFSSLLETILRRM